MNLFYTLDTETSRISVKIGNKR